ncbi:MAG: hypothetical protein HUK03_06215 [Bacteroidaceae bacterium]|nr:hypothetical protein [Bacteroidaceae bacterium]
MAVITLLTVLLWLLTPSDAGGTTLQSDSVRLIYPADSVGMAPFYARLDSAVAGMARVSILHIGGSHVQAGHFSGRMRDNLLHVAPAASRGVLFPFRALRTNAPTTYDVTLTGEWRGTNCVKRDATMPLGIAGAAACTSDTLSTVRFDLHDDTPWAFDQLTVLGEGSDSSVLPIVVLGEDSILPAAHDGCGYTFVLPRLSTHFTLAFTGLHKGWFTLRGVLPDSRRMGVSYSESGVNGAAVPSWLACERLEDELALLPPDLVVFAIGVNDANVAPGRFSAETFKANYRSLISRIQRVSPRCSFLFITNNDCYLNIGGNRRRRRRRTYNPNTALARQAFMDLAREHHTAVFDVYDLMGGFRSSQRWVKEGLMRSDHIHFTQAGYELLGDKLFEALICNHLKQSPCHTLPTY